MTGPALIHDGDMPTPYGVQIKLFRRSDLPPEEDAAWVLDAEGSALLAGIYDPAERKRFAAETVRQTRHGPGAVRLRLEEFGGHKVPHLPLLRPDRPLYPQIPAKDLTPVEAWATGMMDHALWYERATFFDGILAENMAQIDACSGDAAEMYPAALGTMLTAALEHLAETEVDCLEAAAFYAVSLHHEWAEAGRDWLYPFRETWLKDWLGRHPGFAGFARALRPTLDLPEWLGAL